MKKIVILLFVLGALLSFSCNEYCSCQGYINDVKDPDYKNGAFIKELKSCQDYNVPRVMLDDGSFYEVKCK